MARKSEWTYVRYNQDMVIGMKWLCMRIPLLILQPIHLSEWKRWKKTEIEWTTSNSRNWYKKLFVCISIMTITWKPFNKVISVQGSAQSTFLFHTFIFLLPLSPDRIQFSLFLNMNVYICRVILISLLFDPKFSVNVYGFAFGK